jgi:hypothetical protein
LNKNIDKIIKIYYKKIKENEMGNKTIVLTMYGKDKSIESISICLFDRIESYYSELKNSAIDYCDNINALELKDNNWIYATTIGENEKIILEKPFKFDIINKLDDKSLQKVLREVSSVDLVKALKGIDEETKEKIFKNMSKRSALILKEDIESLHGISNKERKSSRKKITETIQYLNSTGEIIIAGSYLRREI